MSSKNELLSKYNIPSDIVISIAGTVGIGKSSLTKALADILGFKTSYESVEDNPYLEKFYTNQSIYGFHLQVYFLAEKFKSEKVISMSKGGFIQDRTIYEDVEIFAKMNYDKGNMKKEDYETYRKLYEVMHPFFDGPDLVIYLEADKDTVIRRINERGRDGELVTPEEYWNELYSRYEEWIKNYKHSKVLRINVNEYDLYSNPSSVEKVLSKIGEIINK